MSRYFKMKEPKRQQELEQGSSTARIELPEFIRFNDDGEDKILPPRDRSPNLQDKTSDRHSERSSDSRRSNRAALPNSSSNRDASNIEQYGTPMRNERRSSPARNDRRSSPAQNDRRDSPRHSSRRSPHQRIEYPNRRHNSSPHSTPRQRYRSRSLSPRRRASPSRGSQRNHSPRNHSRSPNGNRRNSNRSQDRHQGSVFDRISAPPDGQRRRLRRSNESNGNGQSPPHFYRTIDNSNHSMQPSRYEVQLSGESNLYPDNVSRLEAFNQVHRYQVHEPSPFPHQFSNGTEEVRQPIIYEKDIEILNLQKRLEVAETHCQGLVGTIGSYYREIMKLRSIVNSLIGDVDSLSQRFP